MAISFASAPGNLFDVLGRLGKLLSQVRTDQTAQRTNLTSLATGVQGQLQGNPDIQALLGSAYIGLVNGAGPTYGGAAQGIARQIVNRIVYNDNPRISQNLQSLNVLASWQEVFRQMKQQGASVLAQSIAGTFTPFVGDGNGVLVFSSRRPSDGLVLENAFAETLTATVTQDSYTGNATAGNETLTVVGKGSQPSLFAFDWPLGSNVQATLRAIDGDADNSSGNLLNNSGFTDFTGNQADNWDYEVGTAGTHYFKETAFVYGTGNALKITGDGVTLSAFRQKFNDGTLGTSDELDPLAQYAVNFWMRRDGVAAGAGQMAVELVDSTGTVIQDAGGNLNQTTVNLTALGTGYTAYSLPIRTPAVMPSTYYLRFRQTAGNALTNGRSVYIDKVSLGAMTQLYTGGPSLSCHAGSDNFLTGDYGLMAVTNSRGAAGSLDTFQTLCWLLFPEFAANELLIPSSAAPTISDTLITT